MVIVKKGHKRDVFKQLATEGVIVTSSNTWDKSHMDEKLKHIPNLHVVMVLRSLDSKKLIDLVFSWQYYYYRINDKGLEYLKKVLGLPDKFEPETHKQKKELPKEVVADEDRKERPDRPERTEGDGERRGGRGGFRGGDRGGRGGFRGGDRGGRGGRGGSRGGQGGAEGGEAQPEVLPGGEESGRGGGRVARGRGRGATAGRGAPRGASRGGAEN